MEERKNIIREFEEKKAADSEERNRLLSGWGETLIKRIGEKEPFKDNPDAALGSVLEEYRLHEKEIAESSESIKSLEAEMQKLKELETVISGKETEYSRIKRELEDVNLILGKQLLPDPEFEDLAGTSKQQEENLLSKIDELEKKLEDSGEQKGGFLAWLGKNAQMAVSKNLLQRNRSSLQRLYRSIGEKFLTLEHEKALEGEAAKTLEKARELKAGMSSMETDMTALKWERKQITDLFGIEGSPAKRITNLEKRIAHNNREFPRVYLRFGTLAAESSLPGSACKKELKPFLDKNDKEVLEKAELLNASIAEADLGIKKINSSINIEKKKSEIEKLNKAIEDQKQKIAFAEEAISGYRKQIEASEQQIEEMEAFLQQNK